nr:RNA-directed DNA polymerase (reverse transcriptase) domain containing protein [Haemonchus contortus]
MDEAAEAGKSIRKARRSSVNYKTKMTSPRRPDGTVTASRRAMEKVIYDFYSDLFDSHVYLPTHHLKQDGYIAPSVLPFEIRHAITSMRNCMAPGPDKIKPEHLKSLPPVIVRTLARLFTRYLSECKVPTSWKTSETVLLYKKGDPDDIGNYRPICLLSVIYKLFTRVILNRIGRILDEGQSASKQAFGEGSAQSIISTLLHDSLKYRESTKCRYVLTFIDLKKASGTVETEAVVEALGNQRVPTQYIRMLRELYDNFMTRISPFYKEVIINVKRGVRQGDTISPKLFSAALENIMRNLE